MSRSAAWLPHRVRGVSELTSATQAGPRRDSLWNGNCGVRYRTRRRKSKLVSAHAPASSMLAGWWLRASALAKSLRLEGLAGVRRAATGGTRVYKCLVCCVLADGRCELRSLNGKLFPWAARLNITRVYRDTAHMNKCTHATILCSPDTTALHALGWLHRSITFTTGLSPTWPFGRRRHLAPQTWSTSAAFRAAQLQNNGLRDPNPN